MNVIELSQVSKRYGTLEALKGIDLSVEPGEIVGVLGPNGAGKTTAIHIMLGLKRASSGQVRLFGQHPEHPEVRARVGVMLQDSGVPETLTVKELVRLFGRYYPDTLPVDEILQRAGLIEKREARVRTLSGGQRQRLYFALAIAGDPDLIFLDEPTVAMDARARRVFWEQVREFAALGKTILFSTHYLDEADDVASRIVVIHQGKILTSGSPQEIKRVVAAKTVRFKGSLTPQDMKGYAGVQHAEQENAHLNIYTNEPEAFLARLFAEGHTIDDLSVHDTDLESAFMTLTQDTREEVAA